MKKLILTLCLCGAGIGCAAAKTYEVTSPDGKIAVQVDAGKEAVSYTVQLDGKTLIAPSYLALELADGSKVWMNAESKLTIAKDYGQASRTLWLEGEAYFEVAPDSKRPFTVHSGKFSTTAVGTTFNINTSAPAGKPDIVLVEGCVDISLAASPGKRRMHTGQTATLGDGGTLTVADADTYPYTQRRNGFFYFEQEPLLTIMAELGRWYNKTVVFENEQAMQTRLHFVAERGQDLKEIIASLNDMDGVDISAEDGCLVVK